ncbi:lysine 2,3-aminomutase [Candidatus Thiomargarita nelsonii]|uniref:Lysine 2,3-aminomutase n=1 Tax=Candidatus Thiomargarita nelsonii TaxID=1003181 RepID=A0A0A6PDA3_9GAMM|nr:lysine 2,3-aminomutase [Candidatus Thiomargarita nelsonii]
MIPKYQAYTLQNLQMIPQIQQLPQAIQFDLQVVGQVYPFRTNNYVVEELINWDNALNDPLFTLTFPNKEMLIPAHYEQMASVIRENASTAEIEAIANKIRLQLNPHPAGQIEHNIPNLEGNPLKGIQHKYRETVLFFPSQGQTCHAYCSFCFRWPQFVGISDMKLASREVDALIQYVSKHPEVSDILLTGGDPLIMKTRVLATYIDALLDANLPHLKTIRIGTKSLSFWPYRFTTDLDAEDLLTLFAKVTQKNKHLAVMAHFNHPRELQTDAVREAIKLIRETGAQIRTQSPLLAHINDQPEIWSEMWKVQTELGCIPYYMFITRDTGAQHYFGVSLVRAWEIFKNAYQGVTGLARTVRGPSMSTTPGKIQILGVGQVKGEKVLVMQFLQARNPQWVRQPFFAKYDEKATWLDKLEPFGEESFFFET